MLATCKRWIGGIGVYGYICVSRALRVKRVFILSGARSRVFPFSLVLIHRVHPYRSSQVIDEVQRTTCVILRTQPSYTVSHGCVVGGVRGPSTMSPPIDVTDRGAEARDIAYVRRHKGPSREV